MYIYNWSNLIYHDEKKISSDFQIKIIYKKTDLKTILIKIFRKYFKKMFVTNKSIHLHSLSHFYLWIVSAISKVWDELQNLVIQLSERVDF